jgi:hypothetical protein
MLFILGHSKLGTNIETYNVFALGCIGYVEPTIVVIVALKPLVQLRFGFSIMP